MADDMGFIDAMVMYQVPDEYMIGVFLIGGLMSLLIAAKCGKQDYNDYLKANGLTRSECPFGSDYMLSIVITGVVGAFLSYALTGVFLGLVGHIDAPAGVYYFVALIVGIISGRYAGPFLKDLVDLVRDKLKINGPSSGSGSSDAAVAQAATAAKATAAAKEQAAEAAPAEAVTMSAPATVKVRKG